MGQQQSGPPLLLHVVITGLDAHGKSTYLSKLLRGGSDSLQRYRQQVTSNILFHAKFENVHIASDVNAIFNFTLFDCNVLSHVSRRVSFEFWKSIVTDCKLMVFLIDSNDKDRVEEVKEQFYKIMELVLELNCKLLIICSKTDLPNHLETDYIVNNILEMKKWNLADDRWAIHTFDHEMRASKVVNEFTTFLDGVIKLHQLPASEEND